MLNSKEIRRSAAHELRALFSRATDWQEFADYKSGAQRADLLLKFKMGATEHALAVEITSLGQPREIRAALTRLGRDSSGRPRRIPGGRRAVHRPAERGAPEAQRLRLPRPVRELLPLLRERADPEGGQAQRAAVDAAAEVAVRASRHARGPRPPGRSPAFLAARGAGQDGRREPGPRPQRREGAGAAVVGRPRTSTSGSSSLGRGTCSTGGCDSYSYRLNPAEAYFSSERVTRRLVGEIARAAQAESRRYAFTLHSGAALVAPNVRLPAIHCYLEGDPAARSPRRSACGPARAKRTST